MPSLTLTLTLTLSIQLTLTLTLALVATPKDAISHFQNQKVIHRRYVARLLISCKNYFEALPSLMEIPIPSEGPSDGVPARVTVCGDTHGQFYEYVVVTMLVLVSVLANFQLGL